MDRTPESQPLLLLVDDNPENLTVIGDLLHPRYRLRVANGGARALRLARLAPQPDLILLDVMMPEMDGHEVLQRLQADSQCRHIPVVLLTALDSAADEESGLRLGAADFVIKPIRPAVLLARVAAHVARKRAMDALQARVTKLEQRLHQLDPQTAVAGPAAPTGTPRT